jgi:hypothetical protein
MIVDHRGRSVGRATLLVRTADEVFGTHTLVVERWQHRQWERRTRFIVATLVEDSLDVLSSLAVKSYDMVRPSLASSP